MIKYVDINSLDREATDEYVIRACTCNNTVRVLKRPYIEVKRFYMREVSEDELIRELEEMGFEIER